MNDYDFASVDEADFIVQGVLFDQCNYNDGNSSYIGEGDECNESSAAMESKDVDKGDLTGGLEGEEQSASF
jgi:hypothetical protein